MSYHFHGGFVAEDGKEFADRGSYLRYEKVLQEHLQDYETEKSCYLGNFLFPSWSEIPYFLHLFQNEADYKRTLSYLLLRWHFGDNEAECLSQMGEPPSRFPCVGAFYDEDKKYLRFWEGGDLSGTLTSITKTLYSAYEKLGEVLKERIDKYKEEEK